MCEYVLLACKAAGYHSSGGETTGVEGPATEPEPMSVMMASISRSTIHCNYTTFRPRRSLSGTKLFCT